MENPGPVLARKPIGWFLNRFGLSQRNEGIVLLSEFQQALKHLLSKPGMTVEGTLGSEMEPSCKPDMNQAQFGVNKVEVQDTLLPPRIDQAGATLAGLEIEAWTAFHAAENTDQTLADRTFPQDPVHDRFLAMRLWKKFVAGAGLLSQLFCVVDKDRGLFFSEGQEFAAPNPEQVVDEPLKCSRERDRQVACVANAVKTGEHRDDQTGRLGNEARQRSHGVLFQKWLEKAPPLWRENALLLLLFGCGQRQR
jgi:hypothetical protein